MALTPFDNPSTPFDDPGTPFNGRTVGATGPPQLAPASWTNGFLPGQHERRAARELEDLAVLIALTRR